MQNFQSWACGQLANIAKSLERGKEAKRQRGKEAKRQDIISKKCKAWEYTFSKAGGRQAARECVCCYNLCIEQTAATSISDEQYISMISCARVCRETRGSSRVGARGKKLKAVGFEPTPSRTSALSWRLRPLGQASISIHFEAVQVFINKFRCCS